MRRTRTTDPGSSRITVDTIGVVPSRRCQDDLPLINGDMGIDGIYGPPDGIEHRRSDAAVDAAGESAAAEQ